MTAETLAAVGGIGAFGTSIVLAGLAYFQMRATSDQSRAALDQATVAREQAEITREVAAQQVYPLVYAHEWKGPVWDDEARGFEMRYYLSNEGLGPALNVEHGVQVGTREFVFGHGGSYMFRSVQPGEFLPPLDPTLPDPVPPLHISRFVSRGDYYATGEAGPHQRPSEIIYFCRYENLFGDRWETRNSNDPTKPAEVRSLSAARRSGGG